MVCCSCYAYESDLILLDCIASAWVARFSDHANNESAGQKSSSVFFRAGERNDPRMKPYLICTGLTLILLSKSLLNCDRRLSDDVL